MHPGPLAPRWLRTAAGAALLGLAVAGSAVAEADPACAESFARLERAFVSRSADAVIGCMAPEGTLTISLLGLAGKADPMKREQALKVLKTYFEQVSSAALKPREGQAAESLVRTYDYTRRLKKADPATTRLTVTLKKDAGGALRLASLVESAK